MKPSQRKLERALKKLKAFSTKQKRESGDQARYLTKARLDGILAVQTNSADYIQSIMVKEDMVLKTPLKRKLKNMTITEVIHQLEQLRNSVGDVAVGYTNCINGFVDIVAMRADNITSVPGDPIAVHLEFEPRKTEAEYE